MGSSAISLQSAVQIRDGVLFREVAGESVLLDLESGTYFSLNAVGTRVWGLLAQRTPLVEVHRALLAEYEVAEDRLLADLLDLIGELAQCGLVRVGGN
jgi:hypothetical protein